MATLPFDKVTPLARISPHCTPPALRSALRFIFAQIPTGLWLVGGTALAGYYAEHRRSDDLDLFAADPATFRATIIAVQSLQSRGARFTNERRFPTYYHVDVRYENHAFTIDVVLDEQLHAIGHARKARDGIWVPDLPTLFMMKCATLVSRCSEKDLYDLAWLFKRRGKIDIAEVIRRGQQIDGGLTIESLLVSLHGATLREAACGFVLAARGRKAAYRTITTLRNDLVQTLLDHEAQSPASEIVAAFRARLS